jgi:hypothetical protein
VNLTVLCYVGFLVHLSPKPAFEWLDFVFVSHTVILLLVFLRRLNYAQRGAEELSVPGNHAC